MPSGHARERCWMAHSTTGTSWVPWKSLLELTGPQREHSKAVRPPKRGTCTPTLQPRKQPQRYRRLFATELESAVGKMGDVYTKMKTETAITCRTGKEKQRRRRRRHRLHRHRLGRRHRHHHRHRRRRHRRRHGRHRHRYQQQQQQHFDTVVKET